VRNWTVIFIAGALSATGAVAATNETANRPPASTNSAAADAVESEYRKLLEADDAAQEAVDQLLQKNEEAQRRGAGFSDAELNRRLRDSFDPVRKGYEDFLKRNPNHAKAHLAFGSFLDDMSDEAGARQHWEKALELEPSNPAAYNNLAGIYAHSGPVTNAFRMFSKAIELNPREPTYYHNMGTVVYLFRKDAAEYFKSTEAEVFNKVFQCYSNAMRLDPGNFPLASDVAQTYYGVTPLRVEDALRSWTNAFNIARDDIEREGVHLHFARVKSMAGRHTEAHAHLRAVTNSLYDVLKARVEKGMAHREDPAAASENESASSGTEPKR